MPAVIFNQNQKTYPKRQLQFQETHFLSMYPRTRTVLLSAAFPRPARKFSSDWLQPRDPQQYPPILMEADLMICRQEKMVGCVFVLQRFLESRKYTIPWVAYRVAIVFFRETNLNNALGGTSPLQDSSEPPE